MVQTGSTRQSTTDQWQPADLKTALVDPLHLCELEENWELNVCAFCAHCTSWIRSPLGIQQVSDFFVVDLHERDLHLEGMGLVLLFGDPLEQRAAESRDQSWLLSIAHHWEGFPRACQTTNTTIQRLEDIISPSRRVRTRQPTCKACVGGQNAGLRTRTGRQRHNVVRLRRKDRHWAIQQYDWKHRSFLFMNAQTSGWYLLIKRICFWKHILIEILHFLLIYIYRFEQHK